MYVKRWQKEPGRKLASNKQQKDKRYIYLI